MIWRFIKKGPPPPEETQDIKQPSAEALPNDSIPSKKGPQKGEAVPTSTRQSHGPQIQTERRSPQATPEVGSKAFLQLGSALLASLSAILSTGEQIFPKNGFSSSTATEHWSSFLFEIKKLSFKLKRLIEFLQIETDGLMLQPKLLEFRPTVEAIVQGFDRLAKKNDLKLELRSSMKLPPLFFDPLLLNRCLSNVLSNACRFTPQGGTIVVRLSSTQQAAVIAVKDNGIGIAEDKLPNIFNVFFDIKGPEAPLQNGFGMGLMIAKKLLEISGGEISIESELGAGTTVTIKLPLREPSTAENSNLGDVDLEKLRFTAEAEADLTYDHPTFKASPLAIKKDTSSPSETQSSNPVNTSDSPPLRHQFEEQINLIKAFAPQSPTAATKMPQILVVSEDGETRTLVGEICRQDFEIFEAIDDTQGFELARSQSPSLVIADAGLREQAGILLTKHLKEAQETASIPVLLIIEKNHLDSVNHAPPPGADDYIMKPFSVWELFVRMRTMVRLRQKERELEDINAKLEREVMNQASILERVRLLNQFLPPAVARKVIDGEIPPKVEQERQRITVFRMELRGFKELIDIVAPEEMTAMLNSYLSTVTEIAHEHGATVDKFFRDSFSGFFGAPITLGDREDALQATILSIDLWQKTTKLCRRWRSFLPCPPPVPAIVIASGFSTVGNFGSSNRLEYSAVGGPVEEALDLLPFVDEGEVACSKSTWGLIHGMVKGIYKGDVKVPHRHLPLGIYSLWRFSRRVQKSKTAEAPKTKQRFSVEDSNPTTPQPPSSKNKVPISFEPGSVLNQRYEIVKQLGDGGMGAVYHVKDIKLGTDVALKVMHVDIKANEEKRKRLYREVRLARLVSHPNVARIFDIRAWQGIEFITMELIDGDTLKHILQNEGTLQIEKGKDVFKQLCAGLSAAHVAGIVHRDIKPSNIMIEHNGRTVILDFGIARGMLNMGDGITQPSSLIGSPYYMAPEQFQTSAVDQRADIYSLGLVAFYMFTGKRLFEADNPVGIAYKHLHEQPPDPRVIRPEIPGRLAAVILKCLEKDPVKRFSTAAEILSVLE